jgi:hypothetical protein
MPTEHIIELLITERDRILSAIAALGGSAPKRRGRPAGYKAQANAIGTPDSLKPKRKKRIFTAAQRKEQAARMKKYWENKRKAEKGTKARGKGKAKAVAAASSEPKA